VNSYVASCQYLVSVAQNVTRDSGACAHLAGGLIVTILAQGGIAFVSMLVVFMGSWARDAMQEEEEADLLMAEEEEALKLEREETLPTKPAEELPIAKVEAVEVEIPTMGDFQKEGLIALDAAAKARLIAAMQKYFIRYDLDGSGTINSFEELRQLCCNLCVHATVTVPPNVIESRIRPVLEAVVTHPWDFPTFKAWFLRTFPEILFKTENSGGAGEDIDAASSKVAMSGAISKLASTQTNDPNNAIANAIRAANNRAKQSKTPYK